MQLTRRTILSSLSLLAVVLFGTLLFSHNKADVDLWGNLGFVTSMPCSESYQRTNTFSFTEPDHSWINHEWLSEYILNATYRLGGNPLLLTLKTVIGLVLTAILYLVLARSCNSPAVRLTFLLLVMSTIGYGFSTRPHLFTYLMVVFVLLGIRFKPAMLPIAAVPAGILWVNLHGAFFIGAIIMLAYTIGLCMQLRSNPDARKHLLYACSALFLFLLASLVNPYGPTIWTFVSASAGKMRTYLSEWAPFHPLNDFTDHTDFIALTAACTFGVMKGKKQSAPWIIIGILSLTAGLLMRRNIPLFALVSVFAFAPAVDQAIGAHLDKIILKSSYSFRVALLLAFAAASAFTLVVRNRNHPGQIEVDADKFPVGCMQFIKDHELHGNILAFFDWAEYCIWELHPQSHVFLDGRYKSAYSTATIDTFFSFIYSEPDGEKALSDYPTSMVLIHKGNPAFKDMRTRTGWSFVCEDRIGALFLRDSEFNDRMPLQGRPPIFVPTENSIIFK